MITFYEKLTKQAYSLYFYFSEQSNNYKIGSVRRERLFLLSLRAFARYERRYDKEWLENRKNTPPRKTCQFTSSANMRSTYRL